MDENRDVFPSSHLVIHLSTYINNICTIKSPFNSQHFSTKKKKKK